MCPYSVGSHSHERGRSRLARSSGRYPPTTQLVKDGGPSSPIWILAKMGEVFGQFAPAFGSGRTLQFHRRSDAVRGAAHGTGQRLRMDGGGSPFAT